ncbi:hypothetical protein BGZ73_005718 [Actinomortierella ambigua]|nr:hypothetical protein BGZ73_005718 [Actinomortierella ambigua]
MKISLNLALLATFCALAALTSSAEACVVKCTNKCEVTLNKAIETCIKKNPITDSDDRINCNERIVEVDEKCIQRCNDLAFKCYAKCDLKANKDWEPCIIKYKDHKDPKRIKCIDDIDRVRIACAQRC